MRGGHSSQRDNNNHPSSTMKKSSNPSLPKETSSNNETKTAASTAPQSKSSSWWDDQPYYTSSITNKLILTSVLSQFLPVPLLLLPFLHLVYGCLVSLKSLVQGNSGTDGNNVNKTHKISRGSRSNNSGVSSTDEEENDPKDGDYDNTIDIDDYDPTHHIQVPPSPGLTTVLDTALYKAYQAELVPTTSAASQLLQLYIEMKESAALILRECRWCVGVPMSGGLVTATATDDNGGKSVLGMFGSRGNSDDSYKIAIGGGSPQVFLGGGVVVDELGKNMCDGSNDLGEELPIINTDTNGGTTLFLRSGTSGSNVSISSSSSGNNKDARVESLAAVEIAKWNEFHSIQDFAQQCYLSANEAIHRLSTDRLSDSANLTVHDGLAGDAGGGNSRDGNRNHQASVPGDSALKSQPATAIPSSVPTPEGTSSSSPVAQSTSSMLPRTVADFGIGRYYEPLTRQDCWESPRLYCPDYTWADDAIGACQRTLKMLSKHRFLSLVATNGWDRYTRIQNDDNSETIVPPVYASTSPHPFPSLEAAHCLQYLISELLQSSIPASINKFRAATEANAVVSKRLYLVKCEYRAPMRALWESYTALNAAPRLELVETYLRDYHGVKIGEEQDVSTSTTQPQGGKGNVFKKKLSSDSSKKTALLLQQQREKMEKLITEKYWKHPIFVEALQLERCCEKLEMDMSQMLLPLANLSREIMDEWKGRVRAVSIVTNDANGKRSLQPCIHWHQLPAWRELLRRLKSILCRKPGHDESTGIRPFLLDLQGLPRHDKDAVDSSIEISLFKPIESDSDPFVNVEEFVKDVQILQKVLNIPGMPVLAKEGLSGSKSNKATMLELVKKFNEVWDEEMFLAQYKDWYDLAKRQEELNVSTIGEDGKQQPSLTELAESIRETEIELSIAMASKDQLDMVRKRLEDLRSSKEKRHAVLASIVQDVGMRELDEVIVVSPPKDDATAEFPELSEPGLFGDQLISSGEVLPLG